MIETVEEKSARISKASHEAASVGVQGVNASIARKVIYALSQAGWEVVLKERE